MEIRVRHPFVEKGKSDDMDNYRPISILPAVSKMLERAVHALSISVCLSSEPQSS